MVWKCSNCGTDVEDQFQICWNCGTDQQGRTDDSFSIESDAEQLDDAPEIPRIRCRQCGYEGKVLFSTRDKTWWEWMTSGIVSLLVSQRSWIHFSHQICPNCQADSSQHVRWSGNISQESEQIWENAEKREAKLERKTKSLVCVVIACFFSACFLLYWALGQ